MMPTSKQESASSMMFIGDTLWRAPGSPAAAAPSPYLRYTSVTQSRGFTRYDATMAGKQAINSELAEGSRRAVAGPAGQSPSMRVRFTRDDLLLTRFAKTPAPLAEVSVVCPRRCSSTLSCRTWPKAWR